MSPNGVLGPRRGSPQCRVEIPCVPAVTLGSKGFITEELLDTTHVTLKSNTLVDGKRKDNVAASIESIDEDGEILLLGDPSPLLLVSAQC